MFKQIAICRDSDPSKVAEAVNNFLLKHPGESSVQVTFDNTNACVAIVTWSCPIKLENNNSEEAKTPEEGEVPNAEATEA